MLSTSVVVLDFETTGLSPRAESPPISAATSWPQSPIISVFDLRAARTERKRTHVSRSMYCSNRPVESRLITRSPRSILICCAASPVGPHAKLRPGIDVHFKIASCDHEYRMTSLTGCFATIAPVSQERRRP